LTRNTDGTFTYTTRDQVSYELGTPPGGYSTLIGSASPTAYWRLGEQTGTTAVDAGTNHFNGTYGAPFTLGANGAIVADSDGAAAFAGGYADMGSPAGLNITGTALTVEFWAQGQPGTYNYLLSHTNGASQGYAVYTGGDGQYHFYLGRSGGLHIMGAVTGVWDGAWHHFANVYDGTTMRVYVDGTLRLSEAETAAITGYTGNFRVADYNGGGYGLYGAMDEVAVYARALSSTEIVDHYGTGVRGVKGSLVRIHEPAGNQIALGYSGGQLRTIADTVGRQVSLSYEAQSGNLVSLQDPSGRKVRYEYDGSGRLVGVWDPLANSTLNYAATVQADSPAGYWRYNETSGTTVADAQSVQAGTTVGAVIRGATGIADTNASAFDGATGYVSVPSNSAFNFGLGDYTVEAWVNRTGTGANTWPVLLSKRIWYIGTEAGWAITLPTADPTKVALHVGNLDMGSTGMQTASGLVTPNAWHHLTLVYTQSDLRGRLYVDGSLALTTPATNGTTGATSTAAITMAINNALSGDMFAGRLDEVAVYNHALSSTRIQAHYAANPKASWQYAYDRATRHILTATDPTNRVAVTNTYDTFGRLTSQAPQQVSYTVVQPDLARSKSVSCDSVWTTYVCGNANDNSDSTTWFPSTTGGGSGQYIRVDLGATYTVGAFRAYYGWDTQTNRVNSYRIAVGPTTNFADATIIYVAPNANNAFDSTIHAVAIPQAGRYVWWLNGGSCDTVTVGAFCGADNPGLSSFEVYQTQTSSSLAHFSYPASQLVMTDPRGHDTTHTFDARQRPISVADVVGANTYTTSFTYDDCGNRSSVIDRRGNRTDYTYDTLCR
jgi:YD repeat-containing protein